MQESSAVGGSSRYVIVYAFIFVLCCLLCSGREVWDARRSGNSSATNPALRADQRFAAIKAMLPERGVVGYIGEPGAAAMGDYYAAQYALAPLVVEYSANHPLVVGNFPSSSKPEVAASSDGANSLRLVRDFGHGVLLFTNTTAANQAAENKGSD